MCVKFPIFYSHSGIPTIGEWSYNIAQMLFPATKSGEVQCQTKCMKVATSIALLWNDRCKRRFSFYSGAICHGTGWSLV